MAVIIVPRGMDAHYYKFLKLTAEANGDVVVVDRREGERRQAPGVPAENRRHTDRRAPPPAMWERDGVIVLQHGAVAKT